MLGEMNIQQLRVQRGIFLQNLQDGGLEALAVWTETLSQDGTKRDMQ